MVSIFMKIAFSDFSDTQLINFEIATAPKKDKAPPPASKPAKSGGGKQKKKLILANVGCFLDPSINFDSVGWYAEVEQGKAKGEDKWIIGTSGYQGFDGKRFHPDDISLMLGQGRLTRATNT
ncbi:hypothetical protein CUMW_187540 [Citrus unshiu]|nr:hypothetical protein CUMW_187540 [Citrus unshiu]